MMRKKMMKMNVTNLKDWSVRDLRYWMNEFNAEIELEIDNVPDWGNHRTPIHSVLKAKRNALLQELCRRK